MTERLHLDGEAEQRGLDWRLLRRLGEFLRPHLWWVLAGLGIAIATSAIAPVRPYLSKIAVDEYLLVGKWSGFVGMLAAIGGVVLLTAALQYGRTYLLQWIGQRVLFEIRLRLYEHVQRLAIAFFDRTPVGRLVTRVTNDIEGLSELLSSGLVLLIADVLLLFWIVGFMLATEWRLALLTLSVMPILIAASIVFRIKVRRAYRLLRQQLARLNGFLSEYIGGIATTQLFGQQERQFARFERLNRRYRDLYHRVVFYYAVFFPTVDLVWALAIVLILWYAAGALGHSLSVGTLLAFMQYVEMFFRPIRDLTERYNTLQSGLVAAERIFGLLQVQQFIEDRPDAQPMPPLQRGIEFRNVSFSYDGRTPVLRNVSFFVGKGEIVAIVGATGAGKSTVAALLCRMYEPQQGDILIDGRSIRCITQQSLRQRIALVLQQDVLLSRTVEENIAFGRPGITRARIEETLQWLGLQPFIERLPQGLDTRLGERGVNLSAGERQLIALCRAVVGNADVIVLDEATAHVDSLTEELIGKALERIRGHRTLLVIAHRLATVQGADRIVVLHRGEVRELGTHEELLAAGGIYARLYRLQAMAQGVAG